MARLQFTRTQHAVLLEERHRLLRLHSFEGIRRGAQVRQAALFGLGMPLRGIVVAVEQDALVRLDDSCQYALQRLVEVLVSRGLELGADVVERVGHDRIQHDVGAGTALA